MQDRKKDTAVYNGLLDSEGEGAGGMNGESSIDIYTLLLLSRFSRVRLCVTP